MLPRSEVETTVKRPFWRAARLRMISTTLLQFKRGKRETSKMAHLRQGRDVVLRQGSDAFEQTHPNVAFSRPPMTSPNLKLIQED